MKAYRWVLLMLFMGLSVHISAAAQSTNSKTYVVWCQNCNTYQKFNAAKARPVGSTVYVGDAVQHLISAYRIQIDGEKPGANLGRSPGTLPQRKIAVGITPDPKVIAAINSAIKFYNLAPVGWVKTYKIDSSRLGFTRNAPGSGSNIALDGHDQAVFENELKTWGRKKNRLFRLLGTTAQSFANLHILNVSIGPKARYKVTFPNGSSIEIYYDDSSGTLKTDLDTAQDSQGNKIPYLGEDGEIHSLSGGHEFDVSSGAGSQALNNFLMNLKLNGIPVYDGQGPASGYHGWACVKVGSGAKTVYTCRKY